MSQNPAKTQIRVFDGTVSVGKWSTGGKLKRLLIYMRVASCNQLHGLLENRPVLVIDDFLI